MKILYISAHSIQGPVLPVLLYVLLNSVYYTYNSSPVQLLFLAIKVFLQHMPKMDSGLQLNLTIKWKFNICMISEIVQSKLILLLS